MFTEAIRRSPNLRFLRGIFIVLLVSDKDIFSVVTQMNADQEDKKMKKVIILILVLLIAVFSTLASPVEPVVLSGILKPDSVTVDSGQLIVTEKASVFVFSMNDFKLQYKFGKAGEGPREFKITSYGGTGLGLDTQPDVFLISSVGKLSLFTREGKFIKEMKASHNFFGNMFLALGNGYAGMGSLNEDGMNYMTVNTYDGSLKKLNEVCRVPSPYLPGAGTRVFSATFIFRTSGEKVFACNGTDFKITVYDNQGKMLNTIEQNYIRQKCTQKDKDSVIQFFKTSPSTKNVFQFMQPIQFPERMPAIRNFFVKDNRVYVVTFLEQEEKTECFVFDLIGKKLKTVFLPLKRQTALMYYPYTIKSGKLFQLVENEDSEEWELVITKI